MKLLFFLQYFLILFMLSLFEWLSKNGHDSLKNRSKSNVHFFSATISVNLKVQEKQWNLKLSVLV
jgi:hypothetical protein